MRLTVGQTAYHVPLAYCAPQLCCFFALITVKHRKAEKVAWKEWRLIQFCETSKPKIKRIHVPEQLLYCHTVSIITNSSSKGCTEAKNKNKTEFSARVVGSQVDARLLLKDVGQTFPMLFSRSFPSVSVRALGSESVDRDMPCLSPFPDIRMCDKPPNNLFVSRNRSLNLVPSRFLRFFFFNSNL